MEKEDLWKLFGGEAGKCLRKTYGQKKAPYVPPPPARRRVSTSDATENRGDDEGEKPTNEEKPKPRSRARSLTNLRRMSLEKATAPAIPRRKPASAIMKEIEEYTRTGPELPDYEPVDQEAEKRRLSDIFFASAATIMPEKARI
eukprot:GHVU01216234.1.p2 GENE.GHVU01216234.1~~GHVU01216234.1.p2  ORF type:complete len:144 (-),score=18.32 GHVU01216234.1:457-888(-)